jgi:hypothetical protein
MSDEAIIQSPKWGTLHLYREYIPQTEMTWLTVYMKTPDHLYRVYHRDEGSGEVDEQEVDWSNYIIGRKRLRLDFELTAEEVERGFNLDLMIKDLFDSNDIHGFHFEKIADIEDEWAGMSDSDLLALYRQRHRDAEDYDRKRIEAKRDADRLFAYGDKLYNWADQF